MRFICCKIQSAQRIYHHVFHKKVNQESVVLVLQQDLSQGSQRVELDFKTSAQQHCLQLVAELNQLYVLNALTAVGTATAKRRQRFPETI